MKKHILLTTVSMAVASVLFAQSGNVGIGTTTPQTKLDVKNNSAGDHTLGLGGLAPSIRFYGGDTLPGVGPVTFNVPYAKIGLVTQTGQFANSAVRGDLVIQTVDTNKSIIFSNLFGGGNGFEQMRLSGNGNLGIGTTAPTAKLHVAGNVRITDGTQGLNKIFTSDVNGTGSWKTTTELGFGSGWALAGNNLTGSEILGSTNAQPLRIVTDSTERMRVTSTGNVGIGITAPQTMLEINNTLGDQALAIGGAAPSIRLYGGPTLPSAVPSTFNVPYAKIGLATIPAQFTTSSVPGDLVIQTIDTNNSIIFSNNFGGGGVEQMRLNGSGNLGIGISTPTNKLDVNGTARIRTVSQAPNTITTVPLYKDANGVVVTAPAAANYGATTFGSATTIAPATTGTLLTIPTANGSMYKLLVRAVNPCGDQGVVEYLLILSSINSFYSIKPTGSNVGSTVSAPTFTQANKANVTVAWNNVPVCNVSGGITNLNYAINVVLSGANFLINITNNGDTTPAYQAILTKMFD